MAGIVSDEACKNPRFNEYQEFHNINATMSRIQIYRHLGGAQLVFREKKINKEHQDGVDVGIF